MVLWIVFFNVAVITTICNQLIADDLLSSSEIAEWVNFYFPLNFLRYLNLINILIPQYCYSIEWLSKTSLWGCEEHKGQNKIIFISWRLQQTTEYTFKWGNKMLLEQVIFFFYWRWISSIAEYLQTFTCSGCIAICKHDYEFPNGMTKLAVTCTNKEWHIYGTDWDSVPHCERELHAQKWSIILLQEM